MTRVVRHPPGRERPRNAPMATLDLRRAGGRVRQDLLGHWHALTIRPEARRGATRPRKWGRRSTLDPRAQRLVADSLVMLNLTERDGHPDEVEERRPALAEQPGVPLPPCIRTNR